MFNHHTEGFGADSHAPIRPAYPIAHGGLFFTCGKVAFARWTIAYGTNRLTRLVSYNGPCGGIVKHCMDYGAAFVFRLVGSPSCTRSNLSVAGILV